jgi:hypothetical protein
VLLATPFELTARPNGGTLRTWALAETLTTAGAEVVVLAPGASVLPRGAGSLADVARTGSRTLGQRALEALGPGPTTGRTARRRLGADFERLLGDRRVDVAILAHTAAAWALWPRAAGAGVPWVLDLYDVEERRTRELVRHASPVRRPLAAVDARRTRSAERDLLRRAPLVSCVSEADEAHVGRWASRGSAGAQRRVRPAVRARTARRRLLLAVPWRPLLRPNVRGLLWLRDRVLPLLPPRADRALRVAGRRPDAELRRWAAADPRVELVGDPEDVAPLLEQSTFCLTPVHEGAARRSKSSSMPPRPVRSSAPPPAAAASPPCRASCSPTPRSRSPAPCWSWRASPIRRWPPQA